MILEAIRAYFKTVFRIEQIYKPVIKVLKIAVNLTIITNSITDVSI